MSSQQQSFENESKHSNHEGKEKQFYIFVNRLRFDIACGVEEVIMTPDEIASRVDLCAKDANVKWASGPREGELITSAVEVKNGDQFIVTRKQVIGGFTARLEVEISRLQESGQVVELYGQHVIYRKLPTGCQKTPFTDVMVQVPNGYPASMIDRAALPADSLLLGRVKGSPQEIVNLNGVAWRYVSYHPHAGGGGKPWNPGIHGFHSYLSEVLAWLGVL